MQLLGVNEVITNVELTEIEKHRLHFEWGKGMWEQIWLPESECIIEVKVKVGMTGRLEQCKGKHYKTYKFMPY
jgi:hypothetical protein